ncbi:MAG: S8 family serine peptidase, partial [Gemmatimonadales bacterium]
MRAVDLAAAGALVLAACAPRATPTPVPNMDPGRVPIPPVETPPPPPREPLLPPSEAYRRGLMPLASTNVWAFRQQHPDRDGRGVLIGILDSGVDAGIGGLLITSTQAPKIVDLRDFSGEGRVALTRAAVSGDSIRIGRLALGGASRLVALAGTGPVYGGTIAERPLGSLPASDLNGDGDDEDRLPVVVTRAKDGWVLFADADGNGTIANDKPVHDYLVARETFGWTAGAAPAPLTVAANFGPDADGAPSLDLFFDTSGHGTHVAGIAAGHDLYGVPDFDGVAPGAQLLGLKIANNAYGGISVTGSMVRAMDYAIRFARRRQLPLVLNMSFGVGNEREGAARIDALIDSVLTANPDVVFVTSAGNDGPGLSTMGFPGSADRVLSVGATIPPAFFGGSAVAGDVVAFFSSRGGELAKPDILAPGIAYSTVPRWDIGSENKNGTSMASPHVAGAMALLLSGLKAEGRTWTAAQIKQAVTATGRPMPGVIRADEGAGL